MVKCTPKGVVRTRYISATDLQTALQQSRVIVYKRKSAVLFRRGEKAFAMFVVLSGKVSVDFGVDSALARSYGRGALVGLSATLTGRNYTMTATATEDAELVVWIREELDTLLRNRPDLRQQLLTVLGERMTENQKLAKAMLARDEQPRQAMKVVKAARTGQLSAPQPFLCAFCHVA